MDAAPPLKLSGMFGAQAVPPIRNLVLLILAYYLGARVGFALQSPLVPQSILWLPNSILLSALLMAPFSHWPFYLAAAFPAHVIVSAHVGAPQLPLTLLYLTNCLDASLGAYAVRFFTGRRVAFDKLHHMIVFLLLGGTAVTAVVSFADAAVSTLTGWGDDYWLAWSTRTRANLLTNVVLVPTILGLRDVLQSRSRVLTLRESWGALALVLATAGVAYATFVEPILLGSPLLVYAPVPLLLVGAVRFGVGLTGLQLFTMALIACSSLMGGAGVFSSSDLNQVVALQLFLFTTSVPLLCLASVVGERRNIATVLRASAQRLRRQYAQLTTIYRSTPVDLAFVDHRLRVLSMNERMVALNRGASPRAGGRSIQSCFPSASRELEPLLAVVLARGEAIVNHEIKVPTPGHTREMVWMVTCDPVRNAEGAVIGANVVVQDVTEQHYAKVALLDSRQKLRRSYLRRMDLARRMISAQETERNRIARELHDEFSQHVAEMSIDLNTLGRVVSAANPEVQTTINQLLRRTTELGNALHRLSHELHPTILQHVGLAIALQMRCVEFEQQQGIAVTFRADPEPPVSDEVALCLYRIAQEGLNNIARHSGAHSVEVTLTVGDSEIELLVVDDGRGFNPARVKRNVGLFSVEERARLVNGRVTITSAPGGGTMLRVTVPAAATNPSYT
jgi:signal transduction histidine kinase